MPAEAVHHFRTTATLMIIGCKLPLFFLRSRAASGAAVHVLARGGGRQSSLAAADLLSGPEGGRAVRNLRLYL